MPKPGTPKTGPIQPYAVRPTGVVVFTQIQGGTPTPLFVVAGGDYKGFGKLPRFSGTKNECEVVAKALNTLLEGTSVQL